MSKSGRETLKDLFKAGKLPRQQDFEALIGSMLHMDDEGFSKNDADGLKITSAISSKSLVTFFRKESQQTPLWRLTHFAQGNHLRLSAARQADDKEDPSPLLTLDRHQRVGVAEENPQHTLHVGGVVASRARVGTRMPPSAQPVANRGWHVLVGGLRGCSALEVVAAIEPDGGRRAAILHAVAVNAGRAQAVLPEWLGWLDRWVNRRNRIRAVDAWYGEKCDRLELRWQADPQDSSCYALAVRSACDYGGNVPITAHVTELWLPRKP